MNWFKTLINDTLADDKLKLLGYEGIGVRHILMCFVTKSPIMNWFYHTETDPYSDAELARLLSLELQKWLQIKELLLQFGGFAINHRGALGIPKFSEHQSDYYRQKKYRKVTQEVTLKVTPIIKNTELRIKNLEENNIGETVNPEPETQTQEPQKPDYTKLRPDQKLVEVYKLNKKIPLSDYKTWDKENFSRYLKSATRLLAIYSGDGPAAGACIDALARYFDWKELAWTLETVCKNAHEYKINPGKYSVKKEKV